MTAEAIATVVAGVLAPLVVKLVNRGKLGRVPGAWLSYGVAILLAIGCAAVSGNLAKIPLEDPAAAMAALAPMASVIFSLSQLIFRVFESQLTNWQDLEDAWATAPGETRGE